MKKIVTYIILLLVLAFSVKALQFDLQIQPTYQNITVNTNQDYTIPLNFTMYGTNQSIYNISLVDAPGYLSFDIIPQINLGQSISSNLRIKTSTAFNTNINAKFRGYYLTPSDQQPINYYVNITPLSFNPGNVNVYQGDNLIFINQDTIRRHIYSSYFDTFIYSNATYNYIFNNIETTYVCDRDFTYMGCLAINVRNKTYGSTTFMESNDRIFNLDLKSILEETEMDFAMSISNFTLDYNGGIEGLITVYNNGEKEGKNIYLKDDWVTFTPNYFNVAPHTSKLVIFVITPHITSANQTNMTYNRNIQLAGDNVAQLSKAYSVFINYHFFTAGENDMSNSSGWWTQKKIFCDSYPNSSLCLAEPIIINNWINNWTNGTTPANITNQNINDLIRNNIGLKETLDILFNKINNLYDMFGINQNMTLDYMNKTTDSVEGIRKDTRSNRNWIIFSFTTVALVCFLASIYLLLTKIYKGKKNQEREL